MKKESAGIVPYRISERGTLQLYLGHMGGPFWRNKEASWSIIKGEVRPGEDPCRAARREFEEETGEKIEGEWLDLGEVQSAHKRLHVWAVEAEPSTRIRSNRFTIEWPPGSGKRRSYPEIDRAAWMDPQEAMHSLVRYQRPILERLIRMFEERGATRH